MGENRIGIAKTACETKQSPTDPVKLIVAMLERLIATDHGLAKAGRI